MKTSTGLILAGGGLASIFTYLLLVDHGAGSSSTKFQVGQTIQDNYSGQTYFITGVDTTNQWYVVTNSYSQQSYIPFINQDSYSVILS